MEKKYQIFVSSTFRDLADERQDAIRNILDLGHIPAGMELFPASDTEQLSYIKKVIDECDYYILIVGGRYGSLDAEGVSFTEREYDHAVATSKVVLAFVHGDARSIPLGKSDTAPRLVQSLNEFREKVMSGRLVREWTSRENLEPLVLKAIIRAISDYPATGWIRGNAAASEEVLTQLNDLRIENEKLTAENITLRAVVTPKIEGLAALDEKISIRYNYSRSYGGRLRTEESTAIMTWGEILRAIGPNLMSPKTPSTIGASLERYLKENRNVSPSGMFRSDIAMIKNQMIALGFITSYNAQALNAGVTEFIQLTDAGRAKVSELLAVRSSSSANK